MSVLPRERLERRLLILAPIGKDALLIQSMLHDIDCAVCRDPGRLGEELARGVGALLLTEEALGDAGKIVAAAVAGQAGWSDLPVLLLTRQGADSASVARAVDTLGNVTLLERPVRVASLASAARSALRGRERQYQTRDHLREREEADQRKDEFLATLAHELRNPLAPIRNTVSVLRLSNLAQPARQLWEMMERQVGHMVRLVDDLLEVSRITRGKIELRKEPIDLAVIIASAVETSRPLLEAGRHELSVSLPPQPLPLEADAMRLSQVFANLLNNAAKYTNQGGRISIDAVRQAGEVVVTVRDTGIGISANALPKVFDMFMQADARNPRAQSGLGIGLTLVRSLVEMHGGSASAASEGEGRGSEFTVRLPLAQAASLRASVHPHGGARGDKLPRALVVDDNQDAADSLGALLQMLGAEVRVVHSGAAALEALAGYRPEVVFLDLGMPEMDGYEVARRMRAQEEGRGVRLIALTGWGQERDRQLTQAAGFDHHLIKPADIGALQAVLSLGSLEGLRL